MVHIQDSAALAGSFVLVMLHKAGEDSRLVVEDTVVVVHHTRAAGERHTAAAEEGSLAAEDSLAEEDSLAVEDTLVVEDSLAVEEGLRRAVVPDIAAGVELHSLHMAAGQEEERHRLAVAEDTGPEEHHIEAVEEDNRRLEEDTVVGRTVVVGSLDSSAIACALRGSSSTYFHRTD